MLFLTPLMVMECRYHSHFADSSIAQIPNNAKLNQYHLEKPLSSEFIIDTTIKYYPAACWQRSPRVACSDTAYLVVWEETCNTLLPYFYYFDIRGAFVSKHGALIDSAERIICRKKGYRGKPVAVYCEPYFLVAWQELTNDLSTDIYATLIDKHGKILNDSGFVISKAKGNQQSISIATDNSNFFLVWVDDRNGESDIYGTRICKDGTLLDTGGIAICKMHGNQSSPLVVFGKNNYFVIWHDQRDNKSAIYGTKIDSQGMISDTNGTPLVTGQSEITGLSFAFNGENYLITWGIPIRPSKGTLPLPEKYNIYGLILNPEGEVIQKPDLLLQNEIAAPSIVSVGSQFFLTWDGKGIALIEISKGRLKATKITNVLRTTIKDSADFLIAWTDARKGVVPYRYTDIFGTLISNKISKIDTADFIISQTANFQLEPSAAFSGKEYLIVWSEYRGNTDYGICGIRLDSLGNRIDATSISISRSHGSHPVVCYGDGIFFVVWVDGRNGDQNNDIYGARVTESGVVLDPDGIPVSTDKSQQWNPALCSDNINFFVVWEDCRNLKKNAIDIYGARIDRNGRVLDPAGIPIATEIAHQRLPAVTYGASDHFVAWRDERAGTHIYEIYGARVTSKGKVLDTRGIKLAAEGNGPSIAWDGKDYLIVWEHRARSGIYGLRLDPSGKILDSIPAQLSSSNLKQQKPIITYNGKNYILVWEEKCADSTWNICGAEVTPNLEKVNHFEISTAPGEQMYPAIVANKLSSTLIVYSGFTDFINSHRVEVMRIRGKFYKTIGE